MIKVVRKGEETDILDKVEQNSRSIIDILSPFEYREDPKNRLLMQLRLKASEILDLIKELRK